MSYWPSLAQLVTAGYVVQVDSSGNLGVFLNGTEVAYWSNASFNIISGYNLALRTGGIGSLIDWDVIQGVGIGKTRQIAGVGFGVPFLVGLDNRSGITTADGSPITLYSVPAGANQLFDAAIEIDATAFTSGTATYTLTYTENGVSQTIVVTATVINVVSGVRRLIQPDASTLITVQLTGAFVATVRLSSAVLQLAP